MNQDVNKKLNEILGGIDKGKLSSAKKSVEQFMQSSEGGKLKEQLKGMDKNKLINNFMKMDSNELKNVLNKANIDKLTGTDVENILKKLK